MLIIQKRVFIIIEGNKNIEYIQFSAEHYGLMLMWPYVDNKFKGISEINKVKLYLNKEQYILNSKIPVTRESVLSLRKKNSFRIMKDYMLMWEMTLKK